MPLHTSTLFILWSEFTRHALRNVFQEFVDEAFLMAIQIFLKNYKAQVHRTNSIGGIAEFNSLHLYVSRAVEIS